jgi:hypothetical protein
LAGLSKGETGTEPRLRLPPEAAAAARVAILLLLVGARVREQVPSLEKVVGIQLYNT